MCTVTFLPVLDGYLLAENRDEKLARADEAPPQDSAMDGGVRLLHPVDAETGGTWCGVNDHGLGLALLNNDAVPTGNRKFTQSRGSIIPLIASSPDIDGALEALLALTLEDHAPFRLLLAEPDGSSTFALWNGTTISFFNNERRPMLYASSGRDDRGANEARTAQFAKFLPPPLREDARGALLALHRSHEPERGVHSICMHRDDAATRSMTLIEVSADSVRLEHYPGSPCEGAAPTALERPRLRRS